MAARWAYVVGIAVIAGGVVWFATRDSGSAGDDPAKSAPEASETSGRATATGSASAPGRDGKIALGATARPTVMTPPPPTVTGAKFEDQARDAEWAPEAEAQIKHRFATGVRGARLDEVVCRTDQCRLTMSASEAEMGKAMADLETPGGLLGYADHIVLGGPEQRGDQMAITAYVVFVR